MTKPAGKFFYGWYIVAICLLALVVSNGLSIGGIPVFYKFVQNELVANGSVPQDRIQSVYGYAPAITFFLAGLLGPLAGYLLHKTSAKVLMVAGCIILGSGVLIYSQADSVAMVYLAHALLGASLAFVGVLVSTVLVSNWFSKRRGTALGIVLTGTSFGGVVIPQIATPLIQAYGWHTAMIAVSLLVWAMLLPAVIFLVKNRPSDIGLRPDGRSGPEAEDDDIIAPAHGVTLANALKMPIFWLFGITAALIFYTIFVVTQQLNLYLQSPKIGFTPSQAAGVQSLLFGLSVLGKFVYGFLSDRFPISKVMLVSAALMVVSTLTFLNFNDVTIYIFAVLFGLNYGGMFVLLQLMVAEHFGVKEYGKILGAVILIETLGASSGTIITSKIADADSGDYTRAFYSLILVTLLALAATLVINNSYRRKQLG
ncbi:MAG: MFS transporter [Pyrinomonadaceae bacterium]